MKEISDSRIAVVGVGGVGGYVGGMLANYYPHVTFVARGARGGSIREKGLVLQQAPSFVRSQTSGSSIAFSPSFAYTSAMTARSSSVSQPLTSLISVMDRPPFATLIMMTSFSSAMKVPS